jgi:hypothetical protein
VIEKNGSPGSDVQASKVNETLPGMAYNVLEYYRSLGFEKNVTLKTSLRRASVVSAFLAMAWRRAL